MKRVCGITIGLWHVSDYEFWAFMKTLHTWSINFDKIMTGRVNESSFMNVHLTMMMPVFCN